MRKIADSTVRRLSLYLRFLEEFEGQGIETVSSGALAGRGGTTSAQVRKDLSFFGSFGKRGLGYSVPELVQALRQILGLTRHYRVALIGAGKIGSALVQNRGFRRRGFDFVAIFDRDPAKVGQQLGRRGGRGRRASRSCASAGTPADIAVLVTPPEVAQAVADRLVAPRHQVDPQLCAAAAGGAGRRDREDGQPRARTRGPRLPSCQSELSDRTLGAPHLDARRPRAGAPRRGAGGRAGARAGRDGAGGRAARGGGPPGGGAPRRRPPGAPAGRRPLGARRRRAGVAPARELRLRGGGRRDDGHARRAATTG